MKKVSKFFSLVALLLWGSVAFAQSVTDLSGFTAPNTPQSAVRCDIELPDYGFAANGNWLVSTRNANFVGPGASVELANDFTVPSYNVSGQKVVSVDYLGVQVFAEPDAWEIKFMLPVGPGSTGGPSLSNLLVAPGNSSAGIVTYEFNGPFQIVFGTRYWTACVGVNTPQNNAVARWEWDGTATTAQTGDPAYVRYQPAGAWGGAACAYWTPKSSCAFLANAGPPNQAMRFNVCRNANVTLGGNPVPTMTQWGFFLFGLVLLTLAVVTVYNTYSRRVKA